MTDMQNKTQDTKTPVAKIEEVNVAKDVTSSTVSAPKDQAVKTEIK